MSTEKVRTHTKECPVCGAIWQTVMGIIFITRLPRFPILGPKRKTNRITILSEE